MNNLNKEAIANEIVSKEPISELCIHEVLWMIYHYTDIMSYDTFFCSFDEIPLRLIEAYKNAGGDALRGRTPEEFCLQFRKKRIFNMARRKYGIQEVTSIPKEKMMIYKKAIALEGRVLSFGNSNWRLYRFFSSKLEHSLKLIEENKRCFTITCAVCGGAGMYDKMEYMLGFVGMMIVKFPGILGKLKILYKNILKKNNMDIDAVIKQLAKNNVIPKVNDFGEYSEFIENFAEKIEEEVEELNE